MEVSSNSFISNPLVWQEEQQVNLIIEKLSKIITQINEEIKIKTKRLCEQAYTTELTGMIVDNLEVKTKVYIRGIKKIECPSCGEMQEHIYDYTIKNRITSEKLFIPNYIATHCLKDFKDLEQYQIILFQANKVLFASDTSKSETNF